MHHPSIKKSLAKYIGLNPRILKQYKENNYIIYDVIFMAPKVNLRDHKRPESKNTFYKGFNLKIGFFSVVLKIWGHAFDILKSEKA